VSNHLLFLQAKAANDNRVQYCFFREAVDSQDVDRIDTVLRAAGIPLDRVKRRSREPQIIPRGKVAWTLGLKRNIACHLSHGAIIAQFDDDDLYAPTYISRMLEELPATGINCANVGKPAAAKLAQWHMVTAGEKDFGFLDPQTEPLVEERYRDAMLYGYGFSFVYTRAAWKLQPFPNVEYAEDGEFMTRLLHRKVPITLVQCKSPEDGLAAHTYHGGVTSAGEFAGNVRLGILVDMPTAFEGLMPIFHEVTSSTSVEKPTCHSLRRQMYKLQGCGEPEEVGWRNKKDYLQAHPEIEWSLQGKSTELVH